MKIKTTNLNGVLLIEPTIYKDERGYFLETFKDDIFKKSIANINFIQENESKSTFGVLRGLHYQLPQFAQSKLIRVISGKILDIAVDIRKSSPTFGKYVAVELCDEKKEQLFIPKGFAHGFIVLSEMAIINYKVDSIYSPEYERGIIFNDRELNIDWKVPSKDIILSSKDKILPTLKEAEIFE